MKTTAVIIACFILALIGLVAIFDFQMRKMMPVFFARDAVQIIAYEAHKMYRQNPATPIGEIEQMIKHEHDNSVINLMIDAEGKAVDPFGTAFRVRHEVLHDASITTVTSAGPDREFGSEDDIKEVRRTVVVVPQ